MAIKVAINGFGRIGRLVFRRIHESPDFEVVAINDVAHPKMLAHLLKYDTAHGQYKKDLSYTEKAIVADGAVISVYSERDPRYLPWKLHNADVIL